MRLKTFGQKLRPSTQVKVRTPPKVVDPFYQSAPWRALMERLIAERGRRCEECSRGARRIFGDHIRELKDGGAPLDPANILLRCGSCHTRKTAASRALRLHGGRGV